MSSPITAVIDSRDKDLGGFSVRRVFPAATLRTVGPFVFFDHMGPAVFPAGEGVNVRPHPHIGLATVTYLFEGEIMHRDSLGVEQAIRPGDVNWMTAGRGIAHSERTAAEVNSAEHRLHGIQSWIGLPLADEETDPSFFHHRAESLPEITQGDATLRLIVGNAYGHTAPVQTFSNMFYLDAPLPAGASVALPDDHEERAVYVVDGSVSIAGETYIAGQMVVVAPGADVSISAVGESRTMLFGGDPMDGPRHIWWNFVSSSKERIEQAKDDWKHNRFERVPGDDEYIPLPET
ncbi:MAG: pirin family protein [Alphaproteobacteria bacterium]|nr:pirin family protein [Alphaproteobacteria bacterium]